MNHSEDDAYQDGIKLPTINDKEPNMTDVFRKVYSPFNISQIDVLERIKDKAEDLLASFEDTPGIEPDKRMMALAKTNLEQAVMWAIKAIT